MDKNTFIMLHKSLVKPQLEYANSVWSPYKKWCWSYQEIAKKEQLNWFFHLKNTDRLLHLGLPYSLFSYRQLPYVVTLHTIIKHKDNYKVAPELIYNINKVTRGNDFRLWKIKVIMILEN